MSLRRESLWKYLGFALAALALIAGILTLWIQSVASRRWAALEQSSSALLAEIHARPSNRPPPRGTALEGDAWTDYQIPLGALLQLDSRDRQVIHSYRRHSVPDWRFGPHRPIGEILASHAFVVDALRRGAHRTQFQPPVGSPAYDHLTHYPESTAYVLALLACQAQQFAEAGRLHEAMEAALDYHRVCRDFVQVLWEPFSVLGVYHEALELLTELLRNPALEKPDLNELERELAQAEAGLPRYEDFLLHQEWDFSLLFLDAKASAIFAEKWNENPSGSRWRYGFSDRLRSAAAFDSCRRMTGRLLEISARPWSEHDALLRSLQDELYSSSNVVARCLKYFVFLDSDRRLRDLRAHLRLVRVAARYRLRGEILELEDPYGSLLQTRSTADSLKIWSVGADGKDDLGTGKDMVLEVKR